MKNFNFLLQDLTSKLNLSRFLFCKAFQAKKLKFDKLFKRRRSIWIFFFSLQASDVLNGKCINVIETRKYPITSRAYYTSSIPYKNWEFYTTLTAIALWLQLSCQLAYLLKSSQNQNQVFSLENIFWKTLTFCCKTWPLS